jgi:hypothetical protein
MLRLRGRVSKLERILVPSKGPRLQYASGDERSLR